MFNGKNEIPYWLSAPLEFVFQEQRYSSLHSGRSLAWGHFRGDINDPCGDIGAWHSNIGALRGNVGARAELPAISAIVELV